MKIKMRTKIEYEAIIYNLWNLEEVRGYYEKGELYYRECGQFFRIRDMLEICHSIGLRGGIYRRIEKEVTLDDELSKISFGEVSASCFNDLIALHNEDFEMHVSEGFILRIAEVLKRHGK